MYYLYPTKNSTVFDRWVQGLVKAGWEVKTVDYYKINKENKLNGQEIDDLIFGNTLWGNYRGNPWSIKINNNGDCAKIWPSLAEKKSVDYKGKAWIEGDMLCQQYKNHHRGLIDCAQIYRNPPGNKESLSQYILWNDAWYYLFSVEH